MQATFLLLDAVGGFPSGACQIIHKLLYSHAMGGDPKIWSRDFLIELAANEYVGRSRRTPTEAIIISALFIVERGMISINVDR